MLITPTEHEQDNIFNFANPDNLSCQVWTYHCGHSDLRIRIDKLNKETQRIEPLYAHFTSVKYFGGVTVWNGANFCAASSSQLIDFIDTHFRQYGRFTESSNDNLLLTFNLYKVKTREGYVIEFFAGQSPGISEVEPN